MSFLRLTDVTKFYGATRAVADMNLSVEKGEFVSLLGPSGCGKTTTLQMIAGFEAVSGGRIELAGKDITHAKANTRGLGIVFQTYALFPHMTVADNVSFGLEMRKMPKAERTERVKQALALVHLEQHAARYPRELSGGQRQRVALARAVVREPVAFLLDEPLSNLDAKLRTSAREELQQFQRRLATTTIYVTHDQIEALGLGDRIAILDHGRIHQLGTPQEVYDYPADMFVATFIGSPPMNLVEADGAITGFRPEHFLPREAYPADEVLSRFPFHVTRIENLGSDRLVYGILQPPLTPAKAISRIPCTVTVPIATGMRYDFVVRSRDLKRFDPQTGLRLAAGPP